MTGPHFLRKLGNDTFILSPNVIKALIKAGVIDKAPTGKAALAACHDAFDRWRRFAKLPVKCD